jgi:hypothetical protein
MDINIFEQFHLLNKMLNPNLSITNLNSRCKSAFILKEVLNSIFPIDSLLIEA